MRTLPSDEKYKAAGFETRQVVEIELNATVCEYRAEVLEDSNGNRYVADFPANVTKAVQYGSTVKSLAVYMSQYQLIPYARVQEVFQDQFGLPINQGTLCNFTKEAYELSEFFEQEAAESLKNTDVAHSDETGIKIGGVNNWLHVLCTPKTTYFFPHEKRGREAIDAMGLLENFDGILCHDHWKPYFGYGGEHALCNAHHLRELEWVVEFKSQKWARSMIRFLNKANELVKSYGGELPVDEQLKRTKRYREIIKMGKRECPLTVKSTTSKARGRIKQTKERNLLDRLDQFEDATLLFMRRKNVPFTNNQAEQDIRMVKVQQKISGGFRSEAGARHFCRIRGLLITQRKRGESPYTVLCELFTP
jgi:transposase